MRSFRNIFGIICLGIILVAGASPGRTEEETREEERLEERERLGEEERLRDRERIMEQESKILEKYGERFGVDIDTLADLRAQRLGYGEISHALVLSEMSGKSLNEIVAMREADKGWGQIADELGVKLGEAKREVKREYRRIRRELTREERRTLRHSWTVRARRGEAPAPEQRRYEKEKPAKDYGPPERGKGGGGRGKGGR